MNTEEFCGSKGGQWVCTRGFDEGVRPKLDRYKRGKAMVLQDKGEEQAEANYSYYRILYS